MAVKERSQIKGTDAQIKAFAGHNGVLAFATDTKSLHVLSGTAGTTTEFLPSTKVATKTELGSYATKAELGSYATSETLTTELAKKANTADVNATFANYTPTASLATVATSGNYNDLSGKPTAAGAEVGDIKLYAGSNVPNGWFRCDGSTVANMSTNYPKLYAVLGTNVLPNYSDRVPMGASSGINTAVEAGLPEITGYVLLRGGKTVSTSTPGAVSSSAILNNDQTWEGNNTAFVEDKNAVNPHRSRLSFDASRCSDIYGASTTVQPPAVKVAVLIKHD